MIGGIGSAKIEFEIGFKSNGCVQVAGNFKNVLYIVRSFVCRVGE